MSDYIDRGKLIKEITRLLEIPWNNKAAPISWVQAYQHFIEILEEEPSADVVEVVHGRWEFITGWNGCTPDNDCVCSLCHCSGIPNYNYCPNCGAKMDGGKGE